MKHPAFKVVGGSMLESYRAHVVRLSLCGALLLAGTPRGSAQLRDDVDTLLPADEGDDPIGVDDNSRTLGDVRDRRKQRRSRQEDMRYGPTPPELRAQSGEVLTAAPSVREIRHRVDVRMQDGAALGEEELSFESTSERPAELRYRLAIPDGGGLAALEVCNGRGCRKGVREGARGLLSAYDEAVHARGPSDPLPVAHAELVRDARGSAIVLHAAALSKGAPLTLRVAWLAPAPLRGGTSRLVLPARGMDPRAAPGELTLETTQLVDPRIGRHAAGDIAAQVDAWESVELRARAPSGQAARAEINELRCGRRRCARVRAAAGPRELEPLDLVVALDVSPSTEGPARSRLVPAIAELLAAAPPGSRVRAIAFAARAQVLIPDAMEPSHVSLAPFNAAVARAQLGSATRFEAVWELARPWFRGRGQRKLRPMIALVGDGGITRGPSDPFEAARRAHVAVSVLNLADRATVGTLATASSRTGGAVIDAGAAANAVRRGASSDVLSERLQALFAPVVAPSLTVEVGGRRVSLGALRAGDELVWQGMIGAGGNVRARLGSRAVRRTRLDAALAAGLGSALEAWLDPEGEARQALVAVDSRDPPADDDAWPVQPKLGKCDARGPGFRHGGVSSDDAPVELAEARACLSPEERKQRADAADAPSALGAGMPASPLLSMLRQRIIPAARGCFRRDRAGRPDYSVKATFVFQLADREVIAAEVEGRITDELRNCLLASVTTLDVPRFAGVVNVRYPLVTERIPTPEQIELSAGTAGTLEQLFGRDSTPP